MPQTREHLAICSAPAHQVRASSSLTKADLVGARLARAGARRRARALARGTFLAGCPIVPASVEDGRGPARAARRARRPGPRGARQGAGPDRAPADRPRVHRQGVRHRGDRHAGRGPLRGRRPRRGVSRAASSRRCAGCRCTAAPSSRRRRPAHRGEPPGRGAGGHRARRRAGACGHPRADAPARRHARAARGRAATHQDPRPRPLPRGHPGGDGPGPPRGSGRARAGRVRPARASGWRPRWWRCPGDRFVVRSYSPIVTIGGGTVLDIAPPRFKRRGARARGPPGPARYAASPARCWRST